MKKNLLILLGFLFFLSNTGCPPECQKLSDALQKLNSAEAVLQASSNDHLALIDYYLSRCQFLIIARESPINCHTEQGLQELKQRFPDLETESNSAPRQAKYCCHMVPPAYSQQCMGYYGPFESLP